MYGMNLRLSQDLRKSEIFMYFDFPVLDTFDSFCCGLNLELSGSSRVDLEWK